MQQYSTEPRTRKKYFRGYGISTFGREYKRQLLDIGLDATKTASKKIIKQVNLYEIKLQMD